jgi:hypothetical protein
MTKPVSAIDAFDKWWNTRPEPHIASPKESHMKMQQDRMLAIWLSAWDAATKHPADLTDEEIWKLWQQHLDDEIPVFARAILKKASEK